MTLSDFIQIANAYPIANTPNYCVEVPLKSGIISKLTVIDCNNDYESLERVYLYLSEIIKNKNNDTRKN